MVLPDGVRPARVTFEDGRIVTIEPTGPADADYGDLVVLPGLVDSHVHVNEPGRTDWEGFATATRAAAAGGATTIVDMPLNSIPPTVDRAALATKRASASNKLSVDVGFWGGIVPGSEPNLEGLVAAGACGFKSFLVDSGVPEFPPMTLEALAALGPRLIDLGVPLLLHAEHPDLLTEPNDPASRYSNYEASRPAGGEARSIDKALTELQGVRTHILHVSSKDAVEAVRRHPKHSTSETCPHYLVFDAGSIPDGATEYKCAPPIRSEDHRQALWGALVDGSIDMVVSDHSPAPVELKRGDFASAWGGIGGLQVRLPATWHGAIEHGAIDPGAGLDDLARWLATAPAKLAGLDATKGSIRIGADADFVIFDPDDVTFVRSNSLEHRHPTTPFAGMRLRGRVIKTILRGGTVFEEGTVTPLMGTMVQPR